METRKVRLFDEDDPIFRTTSAHLLPKSVRDYIEAQKSARPESARLRRGSGTLKKRAV